jgi:hypothetical protein
MTTTVPSAPSAAQTNSPAAIAPLRAFTSSPAPGCRPTCLGAHPAPVRLVAAPNGARDVLDDEDDGQKPRHPSAQAHRNHAGLALARLGILLDREGTSLNRVLRLVGAGPNALAHLAALGQVHVELGPEGEWLAVAAAAAHLEPVRDALADVPAGVEVVPDVDGTEEAWDASGAAPGTGTPTSPASRPSEVGLDAAIRYLGARCDDVLAALAHAMR